MLVPWPSASSPSSELDSLVVEVGESAVGVLSHIETYPLNWDQPSLDLAISRRLPLCALKVVWKASLYASR